MKARNDKDKPNARKHSASDNWLKRSAPSLFLSWPSLTTHRSGLGTCFFSRRSNMPFSLRRRILSNILRVNLTVNCCRVVSSTFDWTSQLTDYSSATRMKCIEKRWFSWPRWSDIFPNFWRLWQSKRFAVNLSVKVKIKFKFLNVRFQLFTPRKMPHSDFFKTVKKSLFEDKRSSWCFTRRFWIGR